MALSRKRIEELAAKLVDGTITPTEQEQLNRWLDVRMRKDSRELETAFAADAETLRQRMLARILRQVEAPQQNRVARLRRWGWWSAAAAVLIAISTTAWFLRDTPGSEAPIELAADDILPGGNRATLTLADGRTIDLDEAQSGIIVGDGITYSDGKDLTVGDSALAGIVNLNANIVNQLTLTTPKGGTYQITLPDGSNVWLNSGTTLTYPSRFADNERVVILEGEAYFDIREQVSKPTNQRERKIPFKVTTSGQTVNVLGTAFNVSAYPDDNEIKTTLVDGSVEIENLASKALNRIVPNQQATTRGAQTEIENVDPSASIAWKEGFFYFDGLSPTAAFVQLSRWYDLDILYQGAPPAVKFFGMIERDKPLGSILRILEKSGINFAVTKEAGRNQLRVLSE